MTAYLSGRDVFVSAPTGAGKSLTFEIARTICVQTKTSVTHIMETCVLRPVKINTRVIGGKRNWKPCKLYKSTSPRSVASLPRSDIYTALVLPYLDYCSVVWDELSDQLADRVQKLQNRAARVIMRAGYETSSSSLREKLHWDPLSVRRKKQKAAMMYKSLHGLAPAYLQNLFKARHTTHNLRDSQSKLSLPKPRTDFRKRSFEYSGAKVWNELPDRIRSSTSFKQFKREVNRHLHWIAFLHGNLGNQFDSM